MQDTGSFLAGVVVGAVLGLATGLLLTPDVRRQSGRQLEQWGRTALETSDDILDRFRDRLRQIKNVGADGEAAEPPLEF